jgi:NADPH-dependent ferric siderophore reductase
MSALPVAAATLEAMPRDARGLAIFEILSEADRYPIDAPEGIVQHWLVERDPTVGADLQERLIRAIDWPAGRVQTCIAGESGTIKALRHYLHREMGVDRGDTYISGYWKLGLIEDEHQTMKRREGVSV